MDINGKRNSIKIEEMNEILEIADSVPEEVKNMTTEEIRKAVLDNGMKFWELADALNVTDGTLSKWLRHELTPEKKAKIISAIESYQSKKK